MAALVMALTFGVAMAEEAGWDDPIDTDRPDQADSAKTLGAGAIQLETGLERATDPAASAGIITLPMQLRVGIDDQWEAHLGTEGPQWSDPGGPADAWTSFHDIALGGKWNFHHEEGKTLEALGLLGEVGLDDPGTGLALSRTHLALAADLSFPGDKGLGINLGFDQVDPSGADQWDWFLATSFEAQLSQHWAGSIEADGALPQAGDATLTVGGALKYLLTPDTQVDLGIEESFTGAETQTSLDLGFSIRLAQKGGKEEKKE